MLRFAHQVFVEFCSSSFCRVLLITEFLEFHLSVSVNHFCFFASASLSRLGIQGTGE